MKTDIAKIADGSLIHSIDPAGEKEPYCLRMRQAVLEALMLGKPLAGTYLQGSDLSGLDLSNQDLSGCDFSGANLAGSTLDGCNLTGAKIVAANFVGASLKGAVIKNAVLRSTDFTGAGIDKEDTAGSDVEFIKGGTKEGQTSP